MARPAVPLPSIPPPLLLWRSARGWIWLAIALLALAAVPDLIVQYWFLDSVGRGMVFRINFGTQLALFLTGLATFGCAVALPFRHQAKHPQVRAAGLHLGLWSGLIGGWALAAHYQEYLLAFAGGRFGEADPVFGHDIGFYVFSLPALRTSLGFLLAVGIAGGAATLIARWKGFDTALRPWAALVGLTVTGQTFLSRYDLLLADNEASGVRTGAEYLDLVGFFSTLNFIWLSVLVTLGLTLVAWRILRPPRRRGVVAGAALLSLELAFFLALVVRDHVFVAPNEPSIQLPFLQRHMDATLRGYRLDRVRTVSWTLPQDSLSVDVLLNSRTVRNAPILPGWVSYLEEPPDRQHYDRVEASASTMVYGPMLQIYEQEQQLRPYYQFLSVDAVRYQVEGERRMFVSAVRELPSRAFLGPKEWLRYWGSAALMYTHGFGLVMSPANSIDPEGRPRYAVSALPPATSEPQFDVEPRIYVGEGMKDDYVLTGVRDLQEFDHATRQSRAEFQYPGAAPDGIPVSSLFRRVIFALHTGDFTAFLFSRFIDHSRTRVHLYRTPMRRAHQVAPFLFLDSNAYAVAGDGRIRWMLNALVTSDRYPYAYHEVLGDKADERAVEPFPEQLVNYAEDAVKVTIDAFSGELRLYRMTDDPVITAWSRVYPGLLEDRSAMPASVSAQLTYPLQWFHLQFDDIYKRYHQRNPIEFYNVEDLWDDADEVIGSLGRGLTEYGTGDQMTFSTEGASLLIDPADLPPGTGLSPEEPLQFTMLMPFTPEGAPNLRTVILAFQDPERYGEIVSLQVPQGEFLPGPEQADSYIDDDSQVNQQITLWVRHGSEVVRGHTLLLPVRGDLLYVEPLWIVSLQNQLPEVKLFSVVYRGRTAMGTTLDQAIRLLALPEREEQRENELPWFREAGAARSGPRGAAPGGAPR